MQCVRAKYVGLQIYVFRFKHYKMLRKISDTMEIAEEMGNSLCYSIHFSS